MTKLTIDTTNLSQEEIEQLEALKAKADRPRWVNNWRGLLRGQEVGRGNYFIRIDNLDPQLGSADDQYLTEQIVIQAQLTEAWLQIVGDWRLDWEDENQAKFSCDPDGSVYIAAYRGSTPYYFPAKEKCEQWVELIGHLLPKLGV